MNDDYRRGERVVVNSGRHRGIAGTIVGFRNMRMAVKLDMPNSADRVLELMPYDVQREEVWKQTHGLTKEENEIDILRAHALAAALLRARPSGPDHDREYSQWVGCVRHVASVVCTKDGVSLSSFYTLAGMDD